MLLGDSCLDKCTRLSTLAHTIYIDEISMHWVVMNRLQSINIKCRMLSVKLPMDLEVEE